LSGDFLASALRLSSSGLMAASLAPRLRQRSKAADVDRRHLVRQRLKNVAIVMGLHRSRPRRLPMFPIASDVTAFRSR
jgi:hypothetical protein